MAHAGTRVVRVVREVDARRLGAHLRAGAFERERRGRDEGNGRGAYWGTWERRRARVVEGTGEQVEGGTEDDKAEADEVEGGVDEGDAQARREVGSAGEDEVEGRDEVGEVEGDLNGGGRGRTAWGERYDGVPMRRGCPRSRSRWVRRTRAEPEPKRGRRRRRREAVARRTPGCTSSLAPNADVDVSSGAWESGWRMGDIRGEAGDAEAKEAGAEENGAEIRDDVDTEDAEEEEGSGGEGGLGGHPGTNELDMQESGGGRLGGRPPHAVGVDAEERSAGEAEGGEEVDDRRWWATRKAATRAEVDNADTEGAEVEVCDMDAEVKGQVEAGARTGGEGWEGGWETGCARRGPAHQVPSRGVPRDLYAILSTFIFHSLVAFHLNYVTAKS
ncbi:uncharacterized protein BXZ73DRAFT_81827 [Epithele typhae]|uniref:uncharacterized protein n=1 Tax=Epithele typhae TaxID=378194 RepID=UPI0020073725|nr:uncharacterized protein BXZ73DRAFT_81827 [Epithele typhae]KAH9913800.1 hypothetical protein BXZ73DRAFT_81827 [Epithele typhae]